MRIGLLIFNLIIVYYIPISCARSMANRCQSSWLKTIENSVKASVRFASFHSVTRQESQGRRCVARESTPTGSDHHGWPWVCSETKCLRFRTNKAAEAGAHFHKQQAQKRIPLNAFKHSEGKSHRKPLVGWLLMLTPYESMIFGQRGSTWTAHGAGVSIVFSTATGAAYSNGNSSSNGEQI